MKRIRLAAKRHARKVFFTGGGLTISAAAVVFCYATFATRGEVNRLREWQLSATKRLAQTQNDLESLRALHIKDQEVLNAKIEAFLNYGVFTRQPEHLAPTLPPKLRTNSYP